MQPFSYISINKSYGIRRTQVYERIFRFFKREKETKIKNKIMTQVTKNKFWKNFAAISLVASLLGAITNSLVGNQWTAVAFVVCTISSSIVLADQIFEGEGEEDDDEQ